ncbi:Mo-dependent nitrogenase C-terminal domain-containing protein [uncultured Thermosynechococcus sp.]|uniref:Mo-dependent nitrogenase C-terminal domain-containing protein n=1 Tax=uncultured Thermosynechococcus sp. TaxID=436945 RepID=UPI0026175E38|nr:Mo-dependent nitrogenase C-terminal domain-containing protein [uncultured Thermosynechococcus sp.]
MTTPVASPLELTPEQTAIWIKGLLSIACADGHFDPEEKQLITSLIREEIAPEIDLEQFAPVTDAELQATFGSDRPLAENFLRTAVMVALANGIYSQSEDAELQRFCRALGLEIDALDSLKHTLDGQHESNEQTLRLLDPVRRWLDGLEIKDAKVARFLCRLIPPQCPFERDIVLFGRKIVHIPPLCKLNPLYDQLMGLRFRSLTYLAEECGEDITPYC